MKKYLIPTLIILLALIGTVAFLIFMGYEKVQYANSISSNFTSAYEEGGYLQAEYLGQSTYVVGSNLSEIKSALTVYERRRIYKVPEYDSDTAIFLEFSDGAKVLIAEDTSVSDGAFIRYTYKGKTLWLSIKKYRTFERISNAIAPEGTYNKNKVVE